MVQKASKISTESHGRTFKYEFLQITPLEELLNSLKMQKKVKIPIFRDEFFSGSSDFGGQICAEMESLTDLEVICTVLQYSTVISGNY